MNAALPLPPSINNSFVQFTQRGVTRRVKSKDYARWQKNAVEHLIATAAPVTAPRYSVNIDLGINYQSDIDNRVKPILDALVKAGMISDDRYIDSITVRRDQSIEGSVVAWADSTLCAVAS